MYSLIDWIGGAFAAMALGFLILSGGNAFFLIPCVIFSILAIRCYIISDRREKRNKRG